jgi:hypothetical protein
MPPYRTGLSRRAFVKGLGAVMAGSAFVPLGIRTAVAQAAASRGSPSSLTQATFAAHRGDVFQILPAASPRLDVVLLAVSDRSRHAAPTAGRSRRRTATGGECFALVFRGPHNRPLAQGTYRFVHARMGLLALFIVPGATGAHGIHYEALFNRLPV